MFYPFYYANNYFLSTLYLNRSYCCSFFAKSLTESYLENKKICQRKRKKSVATQPFIVVEKRAQLFSGLFFQFLRLFPFGFVDFKIGEEKLAHSWHAHFVITKAGELHSCQSNIIFLLFKENGTLFEKNLSLLNKNGHV